MVLTVSGRFPAWTTAIAALLLGLSGCIVPNSRDAAPADGPQLRLEDLKACDFEYADGAKVPCENKATSLASASSVPSMGWICVEEVGSQSQGFRVYASITSDEWGIQYFAPPISNPISGTIELGSAGQVELYNWSSAPASAFLKIRKIPEPGTPLTVFVYHTDYSTNTSTLQGGVLEQLWSLYDGQGWPIHRLTAGGAPFYAMEVVQFMGFYQLDSFTYAGSDFDLSVRYEKGFTGGTQYQNSGSFLPVDTDCTP